MKYLGKFSDYNIPVSNELYGTLFCFAKENIEIRIYFQREHPYYVEYIAVLDVLTDTYSTYQVYEYSYFSESIEAVKQHVCGIIENAITVIQQNNR